ncbi:methionyl-tRNA formyltransferase, mitochondrial [Galendromus occidentalis]|uniref:methionyl-tRNA formyltransferase n=1 Tax=Galendromus occidentalis TaxID=34638 RepID=A0AAJ6QVF5_9ACAR|nr:methionyl-tRNA formyltransferase, mitochondrial [Galendromus occidentalis]
MRLIFLGSDRFSVICLRALISHVNDLKSLTVVTNNYTPVFRCAVENNIVPMEWPYRLPPKRFDLGIVVSFGYMIPSACIEQCTHGMVNVHPSLLPRWRGAAPLVHTLLNRDSRTGVSLITVAKERFDTGSIIDKQELSGNPQNMEYAELHETTANLGAKMLLRFLDDVEGNLRAATPQGEEGATRAPKVTPSMAVIDWRRTVLEVDALRRAITPFEPLRTYFRGDLIKVFLVPLRESPPDIDPKYIREPLRPGCVVYCRKTRLIAVRCADGWIWVQAVVFQGRRRITANGFAAGYLSKSPCKFFSNEV